MWIEGRMGPRACVDIMANMLNPYIVASLMFYIWIDQRTAIVIRSPTLDHRSSVKHFVSLQFLNPKTVIRTPLRGGQPVTRPLPTQDNTNTE
jgi:hypothetical protein